jgi:hypothetical protein
VWNKFVPFKPSREEWYYYKLHDGSVLKIRYHLHHLMRQHFSGILFPLGQDECHLEAIGPNLTNAPTASFSYPKLIKKGVMEYITSEGQSIRVRPSFYQVVRDVDSIGVPRYKSQVYWIVDQPMNEIMPALLRQSTFVVVGGSKSKMVEGIMREKGILEWLYTKEWFQVAKNSNHPAFMRWKTCNLAIQWGG